MPTKVFVEKDITQILTNKEIVTPKLTLESMAYASLPAPTSSGRILRLSDKARGLYLDSNDAWLSLSGNVINAMEYLAGDGTDEHEAFQAMLDTGLDVFFPRPPVAYGVGAGLSLSTSYQRLLGFGGASLIKTLGSGFNLFTPSTDLTGIELSNLHFQGAATSDATQQYVLFSTTANTISRSLFHRLIVSGPNLSTGFNNGILFDRDSDYNEVSECWFERLIGDTSGHGYGVQLGASDYNLVARNRFFGSVGQGRHAIYIGSGSSRNTVTKNYVSGYRNSGILLYTLSSQVVGEKNQVTENLVEGVVSPAPESGGIELSGKLKGNVIAGNLIFQCDPYGIVVSDSGQGGLCEDNVIQGNTIAECQGFGIILRGTKRTRLHANEVRDCSQEGSGSFDGINIGSSASFGTEVCTETSVIGNRVYGTNHRTSFNIDSSAPVPTGTVLRGNDFRAGVTGVIDWVDLIASGDDVSRFTLESAASIPITATGYLKTYVSVTANNSNNFAFQAPTEARIGKELVITIRNMSGGALGTATFNAVYKTGTWTQPGNGMSRSITFVYDGTNWIETERSPVDVAT